MADKPTLSRMIGEMMLSKKPTVRPLRGGLVLVYRPGVSFAAGRLDKPPSAVEIRVLVSEAKAAGLLLNVEPLTREYPTDGDRMWRVAEWPLEVVKL